MSRGIIKLSFVIVVFLCGFYLEAISPAFAISRLKVEVKDQYLSVNAKGVTLSDLLQEIARREDIALNGVELLEEIVSVHIDNLPLEKGLMCLLQGRNFYFLHNNHGLAKIGLFQGVRAEGDNLSEKDSNESEIPEGAGKTIPEEDPFHALEVSVSSGGDIARNALFAATKDPDPDISLFAYELLSRRNYAEAVDLAITTAKGSDASQRLVAIQALGQMDDPAILPTLREALKDDDPMVREFGVRALAEQTDREAISLLSEAFADPLGSIRLLALEVIGSKGVEGKELLLYASNVEDPLLRSMAKELLDQIEAFD